MNNNNNLRKKLIENYLKGRYFREKKISRISRFLLKSAKLNSRENFQNFQIWVSAKLKIINVNIELPNVILFKFICFFFL